MNIIEIIEAKKLKKELSEEQIEFFVNEYVINNTIADYQASSLLMAMRLNGLSEKETYYLTKSFINHSTTYDFVKNPGDILIDKHSSGGVGDKVSIIVIPILLALGYKVPKISGRGLGFTGGTIDKLDSIKFKSDIEFNEANEIFKKIGTVLMQQTANLVPADKKIYALRDVTGTVDTPGLIVSSILSKKFVVNSDYIFIDLKVGSGAMMRNEEDANKLAQIMLAVANYMKRKLTITLTKMDEPLGQYVGNFLEIKECIDFLQGVNQIDDLKTLIYELIIEVLITTKKAKDHKQAQTMIDEVIENLSAYMIFIDWLKAQRSDMELVDDYHDIEPKHQVEVKVQESGYLEFISASEVGMIGVELGAGRKSKQDEIDFYAGIRILKKNNQEVKKGDVIAILYSSKPINKDLINRYLDNIKVNKSLKKSIPIIINSMTNL